MKHAFFACCLASLPLLAAGASSTPGQAAPAVSPDERSWSAALLRQVWNEPAVTQQAPGTPSGQPSEGLSLRSYQLRHLRVGEAGRTQNLLSLLQKILPVGSSLKPDLPANTLHLLTTPTAHAAIWDLLSTLDRPEPQATTPLSEELQATLAKLAATPTASEAILAQLRDLRLEVERRNESTEAENRPPLVLLIGGGLLVLSIGIVVVFRRNKARDVRDKAAAAAAESASAAIQLSPERITAVLAPLQQQWQQEVMGSLNQAAIRLEAWYQEQKRQKEQLELLAERQQAALAAAQTALVDTRTQWLADTEALVSRASGRFESVAEKLESQTQQLNHQNERVEALATELSQTVSELDRTKDEILRLESILTERNAQLDSTRVELEARERLLIHEQARLSALSLLLEEGQSPDTQNPSKDIHGSISNNCGDAIYNTSPQDTAPHPQPTFAPCPTTQSNNHALRFQFLPPDTPRN